MTGNDDTLGGDMLGVGEGRRLAASPPSGRNDTDAADGDRTSTHAGEHSRPLVSAENMEKIELLFEAKTGLPAHYVSFNERLDQLLPVLRNRLVSKLSEEDRERYDALGPV